MIIMSRSDSHYRDRDTEFFCVSGGWPTLRTVVQCRQSSTVFTVLTPKWVSIPVRKLSGEMQHPLLLKHTVPVTLKYCSASATLVGNTLLMKRPNVLVPIHSADSLALKININKLETKQPIWKKNHKNKQSKSLQWFDVNNLFNPNDIFWVSSIVRKHCSL